MILTSSATRQGLDDLATALLRAIPLTDGRSETSGLAGGAKATGEVQDDPGARLWRPSGRQSHPSEPLDSLPEHRVFRPAPRRGFTVTEIDSGHFRVEGDGVERLVARYDLDNEDALAHLERRLRGLGVIRALEAAGFEPGDEVEIAGVDFELDPIRGDLGGHVVAKVGPL